MRIIHLVAAKEWGGGEVYVMSLAQEQIKHGHNVEIICANRPVVVKKFRDAGFKVTTMQINGHINLLSPVRIALMSSCTADEKTVIHVHRIVNTPLVARAISLLPKHKRPAFICTVHLIEPARIGKKYSKAYNALDRVIFVSKKSKDCFLSSSPNIDSAKLTVIYNSTKVVPAQVEKNTDNTSPISLCFVGRLYKEKGVDTIIEALPKIDNAILAVCGTGPEAYVNELKALSQRLGVDKRIDWVGFTDKVAEYISRADIGLIPSRWEEPCALVNFEYMAAGTPLVTSNTGGQPELITDGVDGLLVAPDDADALANAINRLIDNPELRTKFGKAARETFERRFTYDKFYAEVMAAYDNAIRHRK